MHQLLPVEQAASKPGPKEPSSTPNGALKSSPHADKQQAQRASSTAKATTPKRQDEATTKPAGPKSTGKDKDKDRQERDRSHNARGDAARSHPVTLLIVASLQRTSTGLESYLGRSTLSQEGTSICYERHHCFQQALTVERKMEFQTPSAPGLLSIQFIAVG